MGKLTAEKGLTALVRFAVCDDDKIMVDCISDKLHEYCAECEINKYEDGESVLADSCRQLFDALFLDIDMPGMSGMELAEKIREDNKYVKIVFVTNKEEFVYAAYKYRVFRFVRKSLLEQELSEVMADLCDALKAEKEYISIETASGMMEIKIRDIKYIESQAHKSVINTINGIFEVGKTISEYEKLLENNGFIRTHKGYLVNFRYIYSVGNTDVNLTDESKVPLSRNKIRETKTKLQIYTRSIKA